MLPRSILRCWARSLMLGHTQQIKPRKLPLIRGSIEVTFKDKPNKKIILKPNEKIVVNNEQEYRGILETSRQESHEKLNQIPDAAVKNLTYENKTGEIIETSWVENKLIFQDESFEDIARQLERWYGVSIVFRNDQLKENHLTGSFKNETIRQALDALKFTALFNYEIDNNNNGNHLLKSHNITAKMIRNNST